MSVTVLIGKKVVTAPRARVLVSCAWSLKLSFANRRKLGTGSLVIRARFLGTADVLAGSAKSLKVRAG